MTHPSFSVYGADNDELEYQSAMSADNSGDEEPPALVSASDLVNLEDPEPAKVPITIVTGYLGAGSSHSSVKLKVCHKC